MRRIVLVVHNVRSAHNVGSMLRTADGLGITRVYLTGYSPYPSLKNDARLPHVAARTHHQISKTALGAEKTTKWSHRQNIEQLLGKLKNEAYEVIALEQTQGATELRKFKPTSDIALIGSEVGGLPPVVLDLCDKDVHIPMCGKKESFNVAVAAAIALYHLEYLT